MTCLRASNLSSSACGGPIVLSRIENAREVVPVFSATVDKTRSSSDRDSRLVHLYFQETSAFLTSSRCLRLMRNLVIVIRQSCDH